MLDVGVKPAGLNRMVPPTLKTRVCSTLFQLWPVLLTFENMATFFCVAMSLAYSASIGSFLVL